MYGPTEEESWGRPGQKDARRRPNADLLSFTKIWAFRVCVDAEYLDELVATTVIRVQAGGGTETREPARSD